MPSFKVGDRVRIRSIESMEKEFGSPSRAYFGFTDGMVHLCGRTATVESINGKCVHLKDWSDTSGKMDWGYSTDMLEPESKFSVGQVYKVNCKSHSLYGGVIKITGIKGQSATFTVLKGNSSYVIPDFGFNSFFADTLTLLTGKQIGEAIKAFDEKKETGEVKEVERAAKIGEYIRILPTAIGTAQDHIGKVFKVEKYEGATAYVKIGSYYAPVCRNEYVVLENYSPVKEVKRHAKKGEYIKVTASDFPSRYSVGDILLVTDDENGHHIWRDIAVNYNNTNFVIRDTNYVVLENYGPYKPTEEKCNAKVGDTIKIIRHGADGTAAHNGAVGKIESVDDDSVEAKFPPFMGKCYSAYRVADGDYEILSLSKHIWKPAEVEKAKEIVLDTMKELAMKRTYVAFSFAKKGEDISGYCAYVFGGNGKHLGLKLPGIFAAEGCTYGVSKCSPTDEPNEWIGKCVALCKALHKPIPSFIMGD